MESTNIKNRITEEGERKKTGLHSLPQINVSYPRNSRFCLANENTSVKHTLME